MDFGSPGLDSVKLFREQSDSLAKLLAAFFRDKPADAYRRFFRAEHERRYRLVRGATPPTCGPRASWPA